MLKTFHPVKDIITQNKIINASMQWFLTFANSPNLYVIMQGFPRTFNVFSVIETKIKNNSHFIFFYTTLFWGVLFLPLPNRNSCPQS